MVSKRNHADGDSGAVPDTHRYIFGNTVSDPHTNQNTVSDPHANANAASDPRTNADTASDPYRDTSGCYHPGADIP